jgi:hypothetical protein
VLAQDGRRSFYGLMGPSDYSVGQSYFRAAGN